MSTQHTAPAARVYAAILAALQGAGHTVRENAPADWGGYYACGELTVDFAGGEVWISVTHDDVRMDLPSTPAVRPGVYIPCDWDTCWDTPACRGAAILESLAKWTAVTAPAA